jgi:hypothetical protein
VVSRSVLDDTALPRDKELARALHCRVENKLTLAKQWYSIWDMISPGITQPLSCLVGDDVFRFASDYHGFEITEGLEAIRSVVKETNARAGVETDLEAFVEKVFAAASPENFSNLE